MYPAYIVISVLSDLHATESKAHMHIGPIRQRGYTCLSKFSETQKPSKGFSVLLCTPAQMNVFGYTFIFLMLMAFLSLQCMFPNLICIVNEAHGRLSSRFL